MPFKSTKQEKFMFSQHPQIAKKWASETPNQSKLPTYAHLDSYFDGGTVPDKEVSKILNDPKAQKALKDVQFLNGAIETNLNPDITPKYNRESPDPSLEPDPSRFPGGRISPEQYKDGGKIPGKAKVPGDSPKNDTKLIAASPGEVVLPRSVTQSPDAPEKAKKFMKLQRYFEGGMCK
jgi:hypothetical protein